MVSGKQITLAEIAKLLGAQLIGQSDKVINGLATLQHGTDAKVAFLSNPVYKKYLHSTEASAVIVSQEMADYFQSDVVNDSDDAISDNGKISLLVHSNPYLGYARLSRFFDQAYDFTPSIHPSAVIADSAKVHESCFVGANAAIEDGVTLAEGVFIGANTVVGKDSFIGRDSRLWANVTLYSGVFIGERSIVHSGAVIGSDGFGNASENGRWIKIAQLGGVRIGDDVEIGSNTSIDRGALDDTILDNGVRVDNLVQIAHNVHVGENTALAGCTGIAGSTVIGKNCIIGGGTGIAGHIEIADHVAMTGMTMVTKSISQPGLYSSGTGVEPNSAWRRMVARMRNIDALFKRVKQIEKKLGL